MQCVRSASSGMVVPCFSASSNSSMLTILSASALLQAIILKMFREYVSFSDNSAFAVHRVVRDPGAASSVVALFDAYCQMYP